MAQGPVQSSVVVDSNPAVFAVLAALNAGGYSAGVGPNSTVRDAVRQQMLAHPVQVLTDLQAFYRTRNAAQGVAPFVTLALFLGNPPGLTLTVPPSGLPPSAESVSDLLPLARDFWQQAHLEQVWSSVQPQYTVALAQDAAEVRAMLAHVDSFFRMTQSYAPRQYFIFPDAMVAPGESAALNYENNYYLVANLHLHGEMAQVRHTYLHFLLDPLIGQYPAAVDPVEQEILPLVARAPALNLQFKRDPTLLYTECLVRAVEIQLDPGTELDKAAAVQAAMHQGLVLTGLWYGQLSRFRADPASFTQFYPEAAFALRIADLAGRVKHMQFSAPAPAAASASEPVRVPLPLQLAQQRFDAHDLTAATTLASAELQRQHGDRASAYYLLGKIAALRNQPRAALQNFQATLTTATPAQHHVRAWANMYLARLCDAEHNRAQAVAYYKAALAAADTPTTRALAQAGIKAPYLPPGVKH
ncbi:MAG: hypothetical protein ACRD1C_13615 [Terriglobales bacterium]